MKRHLIDPTNHPVNDLLKHELLSWGHDELQYTFKKRQHPGLMSPPAFVEALVRANLQAFCQKGFIAV